MKIVDLNGQEITVTDVKLAIMQADDYRHYCHAGSAYAESDTALHAYWKDIHDKLIALKI